MSHNLRDLLGLPEPRTRTQSQQAEAFSLQFRERMAGLNEQLRSATHASHSARQLLDAQRSQLFEVYHKAAAEIDRVDSHKAAGIVQRVLAAVAKVEQSAEQMRTSAAADQQVWLKQESHFDDALLRIGEFAEAGHPQAPTLQKIGAAIRARVNERKYRESIQYWDQLQPKLDALQVEVSAEPSPELTTRDQQRKLIRHRARLEQARKIWVAVRSRARHSVGLVKSALRKAYGRDEAQLGVVMERVKEFDAVLSELSDDLRLSLDNYLQAKPTAAAETDDRRQAICKLIARYTEAVEGHQLLAAVDADNTIVSGVQVRAPLLAALKHLQLAIAE